MTVLFFIRQARELSKALWPDRQARHSRKRYSGDGDHADGDDGDAHVGGLHVFLESFQCSTADDDVDGDSDHHDGGDAGDAQVHVDADADAGDDAEDNDSDHIGVERRASRRAHVARLHCESAEANERVFRMRGTMSHGMHEVRTTGRSSWCRSKLKRCISWCIA